LNERKTNTFVQLLIRADPGDVRSKASVCSRCIAGIAVSIPLRTRKFVPCVCCVLWIM